MDSCEQILLMNKDEFILHGIATVRNRLHSILCGSESKLIFTMDPHGPKAAMDKYEVLFINGIFSIFITL